MTLGTRAALLRDTLFSTSQLWSTSSLIEFSSCHIDIRKVALEHLSIVFPPNVFFKIIIAKASDGSIDKCCHVETTHKFEHEHSQGEGASSDLC